MMCFVTDANTIKCYIIEKTNRNAMCVLEFYYYNIDNNILFQQMLINVYQTCQNIARVNAKFTTIFLCEELEEMFSDYNV